MTLDRRQWITATGTATLAAFCTASNVSAQQSTDSEPFRYCLNTGTIRGQNLGIVREVEVAAQAGYSGIEPWVRSIEDYVKGGGSLRDLRKRIDDSGLKVESAIAFAPWIVDDPVTRKQGLEQAAREMGLLAELGGTRIAAPPAGARDQSAIPLSEVAQRYRALLEVGVRTGVTPQLEVWGFSKTLSRLGEVAFVAVESGHPNACLLLDVYHIYKGGSDFVGLDLLAGSKMHVFHMNDYPSSPPREQITDAHRVYTGDGVAPLKQILKSLMRTGYRGVLSLELFNRDYWMRDALEVAKTGLAKMKQSVAESMG